MKYLATDLDGTILQKDQTINKEDVEALIKFKEAGNTIIVSTGRGIKGIKKAFENYPEIKYDYVVACNGAIVLDNENNIVFNNYIDYETAISLFNDLLDKEDILVHFEDEVSNYVIRPEHNRYDEVLADLEERFATIIKREDILEQNKSYPIISLISMNEDIEVAENIKNFILNKYGHAIEAYRNQHFVDISAKNCSKGNGLKKLLEKIGIEPSELYVIGDSYNDLAMFEITDNSYTFTYAEEGVKLHAKHIVKNEAELINSILN